MNRFSTFLILLTVSATVFSQAPKEIRIEFAGEGSREVWITDAKNLGAIKTPESVTGLSIKLDAPANGDGLFVMVHDKKTGNVAQKPLTAILATGSWKVLAADEKRVFRMDFLVTSGGQPVSGAVVKAKAGPESREALVTVSDEGKASLYNLLAGPVDVIVQYKTPNGIKSTPSQAFDAKLGAGPPLTKTIAISDSVETIPEKPKPEEKVAVAEKPVREAIVPPNPGATLVNLFLGIAVIGGACYGLYLWIKRNPQRFEDALKTAGIGDQKAVPTVDSIASPVHPKPLEPIVLDSSPSDPAMSLTQAAVPFVPNPRLVKPDGSIVMLVEGSNLLGRDEGLTVSLVGESSVSRQHARIDVVGGQVTLTDLGSTNGTFVNGARAETVTLSVGDTVQFGACAFRYES